jgi:hypothetical protein
MKNLDDLVYDIEKRKASTIPVVVGQSELLPSCSKCGYYTHPKNKKCLREGCENY